MKGEKVVRADFFLDLHERNYDTTVVSPVRLSRIRLETYPKQSRY